MVINLALFFRSIYLGWLLSLVYAFALYLSDRYKRESFTTVGIVFTGGVIATLLIGLLHNIIPGLSSSNYAGGFLANFYTSFVKAAIPEEAVKLLIFFATAWTFKLDDFSEEFDGMLYMGMIGAGFGAYEDFSYIFNHTFSQVGTGAENIGTAFQFITWQRAFPGHILINAVSGFFLGKAKFTGESRKKYLLILLAMLVAILSHGLFNLAGSSGGTGWLIIYVLALGRLFFFFRSELLQDSPYLLIERFYEGENLYNWEIMNNWKSDHPIERYAELYHKKSQSSIGFFPVIISIIVLYPVAISGVYYLNLFISRIFP